MRCYKTILNNTRFSIHDNIEHHFNYIHCLLDKAQNENELQRAKLTTQAQSILKNASSRFDKDIFSELEKIVLSRVAVLRGGLQDAAKNFMNCNENVVINCGKDSLLQLAGACFELGN